MNPIQKLQEKVGVNPDGDFGPKSIKAAAFHFKLTNEQAAHFFGQCAHETGEFKVFEENLNYSAAGLQSTFRKYFPNAASTKGYARNPEKIANKVYADRMGNGNEASGDGWKYRGRGAIQLTGKSNYAEFEDHMGFADTIDPSIVAGKFAFESAKFFFDRNGLWSLCKDVSDDSIFAVTRRVNGGSNGLAHRKELTEKFYAMLKK